jgi:hypothetical protein
MVLCSGRCVFFGSLGVGGALMIAQKILFAVRVIGCLMCDISGVNV